MEKSKFAYYADEILRSIAIWLMSAICLRYVIKPLYLIIILATAITMLITLLLRLYYAKKNISREKIRQIDEAMQELLIADRGKFLLSLASALGGRIMGDGVSAGHTIIYPYFCGKMSLEKLNEAYNLALDDKKRLLILCDDVSSEVTKNLPLFSEVPVSVLKKSESYAFLLKYSLVPKSKERPKKRTPFWKTILKKSKIKGYLTAAVILLISASFSPYAILCIIASAFNIAMSILCEAKGK